MPAPQKPKGTPDDLAEVERALSVLQGRHPEHERARREDQEARERRSVQHDETARVASSAARSRYIRVAAIAVPVVLLLGFIGTLTKRELGRRARVGAAGEPFHAFGFTTIETSSPSTPGTIDANVEPGCFLAVSTEGGVLRVARGGATLEGKSPILFCTCANERVGLTSMSVVGRQGGLLLLRTDAATLGGSRAFSFAPFKPASILRTDEQCSEASLDAWIDARRYPPVTPEPKWFAGAPRRAALAAGGFKVAAVAPANVPFVVLELPKDSCMVVTSDQPADRLGLRMKGGVSVIPETAGTLARCAQGESTMLVSREGSGEVAVLVAPAAALGGMRGLREIVVRDGGLALAATQIPAADRAWDAKQLLLASQVPEALISVASTPEVPVEAEPRVVTISFETPNALIPDTPADVYSYCDPSLEARTREAMCIFSGPQKWRTEGSEAVGGIARAKLPFWLYSMQGVNDPLALKVMTQLFSIARRLGRDGFAPTTLEALTELPTGVEVLGRTGEDAIVAVGVAPSEPWVYPLTDGPPWTLDGAPRIVAVKPLEKVTLNAMTKVLPPKPSRRTVVFRRQKR